MTRRSAGDGIAGLLALALLAHRRDAAEREEAVLRAAHELRGALTTIALACEAGFAGLPSSVDPERAVEVALARARVALADLAPAARPAALECFDARELLSDCVAAAGPFAEQSGVALIEEWEGGPVRVTGERARLGLALTNLITNAIEHGGGRVTARGRRIRGAVSFEVSDDGPGLPAALAVLSRRARPGVGCRGRGLAIVQDVAARHRGHLAEVPSRSGARLALVLPASPPR